MLLVNVVLVLGGALTVLGFVIGMFTLRGAAGQLRRALLAVALAVVLVGLAGVVAGFVASAGGVRCLHCYAGLPTR